MGDGGELTGPCMFCSSTNPVYHDIMLDPEQLGDLQDNPGMKYPGQGGGDITPRNQVVAHHDGSELILDAESTGITESRFRTMFNFESNTQFL